MDEGRRLRAPALCLLQALGIAPRERG